MVSTPRTGKVRIIDSSAWEKRVIRVTTKPSTAQCDLNLYTRFLIAEPKYGGCNRLGEILKVSRYSVNRFLERERYIPKDLFEENKAHINLCGGKLSGDDTVIEKLYSQQEKTELIGYYWSGKHHKAIKGINLITLYYTDVNGVSVPINYRIYKRSEGKTKNDYLREMVCEVISWGIKASYITTDSWYSSKQNLKFFKNQGLNFGVGLAKNRSVRLNQREYVRIGSLDIPDDGLRVELKSFGKVKVFKRVFKNGTIHYYAVFLLDENQLEETTRVDFRNLFAIHWGIEVYHRAIKQLCNLNRFFVRKTNAILTHVFCSLRAFCQLELMRVIETIETWYEVQRNLYLEVARQFILESFTQEVVVN